MTSCELLLQTQKTITENSLICASILSLEEQVLVTCSRLWLYISSGKHLQLLLHKGISYKNLVFEMGQNMHLVLSMTDRVSTGGWLLHDQIFKRWSRFYIYSKLEILRFLSVKRKFFDKLKKLENSFASREWAKEEG